MRSSILRLVVLSIAAMSPLARGEAQSRVPVTIGERVRITTPRQRDKFRYVGRVVSVQADTVSIQADGTGMTQAVPVADMTAVEISAGTETHGLEGMGYGSVIGMGVGAIVGAVTYKKPHCTPGSIFGCPQGSTRGLDVLAGAIVGGVVGLAVGGLVGITHTTERWIYRPLGGARIGFSPAAHGGSISLGLRF